MLRRVAAIYDIHGNLPALEAVLEEIRRIDIDLVVVGGDVIPGPLPRDTLVSLSQAGFPLSCIQGNGEVAVLEEMAGRFAEALPPQARAVIYASARALTPEDADLMASWPMSVTLTIAGLGRVLFCHGTPRHHNEVFTAATAESLLLPLFDALDVALVVCGHTHMQFDRVIGRTRVVNAGSVGLPFGTQGADWLLLGPGVQLQHTDYDVDAAVALMRQSPGADIEYFTRQILTPPPAAQMIETFRRAELRYAAP